ncbi:hypothetical protein [Microcoleus sp. T2B6]|uniref:hypothetical protein n=1 Tax=Microcoleus sp. T2B6 TaxID=3055424 RepID=UPI0040408E37
MSAYAQKDSRTQKPAAKSWVYLSFGKRQPYKMGSSLTTIMNQLPLLEMMAMMRNCI